MCGPRCYGVTNNVTGTSVNDSKIFRFGATHYIIVYLNELLLCHFRTCARLCEIIALARLMNRIRDPIPIKFYV